MKKFLILAYPRSASSYTAVVFHKIGFYVNHERDESVMNHFLGREKELDGLVTGLFIRAQRDFSKYEVIFHQTRDPLKVISSALYMSARAMADLIETCNLTHRTDKNRLWWVMKTWLLFTEKADQLSVMRFQVEKIELRWWRILRLLELPNFVFPQRVPTYVNTYSDERRSKKLGWEQLFDCDYEMAKAIQQRTLDYGYLLGPSEEARLLENANAAPRPVAVD